LERSLQELIEARKPGFSLEQPFYTSEAVFQEDMKRVFLHHWLFAGHIGRVPKGGDYFTLELGQESIVIIRDEHLQLHALWNVCRHRGSRICLEPEGTAKQLVCPYHQWVYRPDGSLLSARLMPDDFNVSSHGLFRAHVQVVAGLIFVSAADVPPDFDSFRESMEPRLRPHDLAGAKIAHRERYEIAANWKLVVENSRECYHCGIAHPQYCKAVGFAAAIGSEARKDENASIEKEHGPRLRELGLEIGEVPFPPNGWYHYRRFFPRPGFVTESMDGYPVAPLMGTLPERDIGISALVTLPNLLLEASSDYVMTLRLLPKTPLLTEAEVCWLVRGDAREGFDYSIDRLTEFWRLTSNQDWELCENNQSGLNSSRYVPGAYSPSEGGVEHFVQWYLRQLTVSQEPCGNHESYLS
jgi:Rieske 2Fe-2S family protein